MPWVKRTISIHRHGHVCHKPFIWLWIKVGSIWSCRICGSNWVVFKYPGGMKDWRQIL